MARIYRQTYTKPLPEDAQVITRRGKRLAKFRGRDGRQQTAPLSADGAKVILETKKWYIEYRDGNGSPRKAAGYTDKQATEQKAAQLERQAAHQETGLIDRFAEHRKRPLSEHIEEWHASLIARGNTAKHADQLKRRVEKIIEGSRSKRWTDIEASRIERFLGELRSEGFGVQTCNFYIQGIKQFCRWMVQDGRAPDSPVAHLSRGNVRTDRRHDRRALETDELRLLIVAAKHGPDRGDVPGPERAVLYQVSAETGLRVGELRTLTWGCVDTESSPPTVTVKAAYSKHRREDVQPLADSTVATLSAWWTANDEPDADSPVFPNLKKWTKTAKLIREDLETARTKWLERADDAEELEAREATKFLSYEDEDGKVADFHALRHTFITNLVRGNVQPQVAQKLARHSTITLTMDRYTHVVMQERADALHALPKLVADQPDQSDQQTVRSA